MPGVASPPEELIKALSKKYNTATSLIYAKDGKIEGYRGVENPPAEDILGILTDPEKPIDDVGVLLWACKTESLQPDDVQPVECLKDGDGVVHILAIASGPFSSFAKTDSTQSPAVRAIEEYLIPKIAEVWEEPDVNLENVLARLNGDADIKTKLFGNEYGTIALITSLGDSLMMDNKPSTYLKGDWGWSTDHAGFGQSTASAKPNKFAAAKAKLEGTAAVVNTPAAASTTTTATSKGGSPAATGPVVWIKPTSVVQGNAAKKDWYKEVFDVKTDAELEKIVSIAEKVLFSQPICIPSAKLASLKNMKTAKNYMVVAPKDVPELAAADRGRDAASPISIPVINEASKAPVAKIFTQGIGKAVLDHASGKKHSLEQIQALVKEYKSWWDQLKDETKWQLEDSFGWPYELFLAIGNSSMQNLAVLAFNLSCQGAMLKGRVAQLEAKYEPKPEKKADGTVDKGAGTVVKNKFQAAREKAAATG